MDDHDRVIAAAHLASALVARSQGGPHPDYGHTAEEWAVQIFVRVYESLPVTLGMNRTP
jgi:hypothetical protein